MSPPGYVWVYSESSTTDSVPSVTAKWGIRAENPPNPMGTNDCALPLSYQTHTDKTFSVMLANILFPADHTLTYDLVSFSPLIWGSCIFRKTNIGQLLVEASGTQARLGRAMYVVSP